ncbi:MAG: hypothetical protein KAT00_15465 [Planctomycetes bacterium]|nr:hypothetical protein [Planctomycetota bacterium]
MKYNSKDFVVTIGGVEIKTYAEDVHISFNDELKRTSMNKVVVMMRIEVDLESAIGKVVDDMVMKNEMELATLFKWQRLCLYQNNPGGSYE